MAAGITKVVFVDRDGVLNEDRPDHVKTPDELVMIDGAAEAISRLVAAGRRVVVITNQSAIGRGLMDDDTLARIHDKLDRAVSGAGGVIDRIICCPDPPWAATGRRKPAPGMLIEALDAYGCRPEDTPFIGDQLRDLEAAAAAGCPRVLVRTGKGEATLAAGLPPHVQPVSVRLDLAEAATALLADP